MPVIQESGRTNHEEIFIDRSEQLKALDCHLVYTVPISLLYSDQAVELIGSKLRYCEKCQAVEIQSGK